MELYLSLTVRLWSCEPIILALPLNRWWSRPSPRLQPVRGRGELDATDLGNAFDCTRVCVNLQPYDTCNEDIFIYSFVHYNSLSLSFLFCMSPCPLPVHFVAAVPLSEEDFEKLPASTVPEMQRSNLAPVILQLKALGIDNVLRFSFLSVSGSLCILRVAVMCSPTVKGIVVYVFIRTRNVPKMCIATIKWMQFVFLKMSLPPKSANYHSIVSFRVNIVLKIAFIFYYDLLASSSSDYGSGTGASLRSGR